MNIATVTGPQQAISNSNPAPPANGFSRHPGLLADRVRYVRDRPFSVRSGRQAPIPLTDVLRAARAAASVDDALEQGGASVSAVPAGLVAESLAAGYLLQARTILESAPLGVDRRPAGLPPGLEALREYHLPPACLAGTPA